MLLVVFSLLAIASVPLAGGRLSRLADVAVRHTWAVFAGLAVQVLFLTVMPGQLPSLQRPIHVATYAFAVLFLVANRRISGLWLVAVGAATNLAAICANGGVMPAAPQALEAAGLSYDKGEAFANSAAVTTPHLQLLGDVFAVPASWPLSNVFSVGDVLIAVGVLIALHAVCGSRVPGSRSSFAAVTRHPGFLRLWLSQATSNLGDFVYTVALAVVLVGHGSAMTLAGVFVVQALTAAIAGFFGGALADRVSRRRLMVVADALRAAAVGSLLLVPDPGVAQLVAVAAVLGAGGGVFQPAMQASLPNVVPENLLVAANSLMTMTFHTAVLAGPLLGGLLATGAGVRSAFALNAISFVVSAALIARTAVPRPAAADAVTGLVNDLVEGLRYVARARATRVLIGILSGAMLAAALRQPVEPLFITGDLGGSAADLGVAAGAWGLGMVLGSGFAPRMSTWLSGDTMVAVALLVMGAGTVGAVAGGTIGALLACWVVAGAGNALLVIAYETALQQRTPDAVRGRVIAANEAGLDSALVLGVLGGGAAGAALGVPVALALSGIGLVALGGVAFARLGEVPVALSAEGVLVDDRVLVRVSAAALRARDVVPARVALRLGEEGPLVEPVPAPPQPLEDAWRAAFVVTRAEFHRWASHLAVVRGDSETVLPPVPLRPLRS